MKSSRSPFIDRVHAAALLIGAVLICAYWTAFYLSDLTKPDFVHATDPAMVKLTLVYMGFESAFPLPDGFVAVTSALAAIYLIGRDAKAVLFGLLSGGGMVFLALIDIWFNVLHGLYAPAYLARDVGMRMEVAINVACLAGAGWSVWRLWGHPLRVGGR